MRGVIAASGNGYAGNDDWEESDGRGHCWVLLYTTEELIGAASYLLELSITVGLRCMANAKNYIASRCAGGAVTHAFPLLFYSKAEKANISKRNRKKVHSNPRHIK